MQRIAWVVVGLSFCLLSGLAQGQSRFAQRWNYVQARLDSDAGLNTFLDILKQSKEVGCTHILMPESRWLRFADDAGYQGRVEKVKAAAKEMNLTIVPVVFALGYSGRYLGFDPNLGAGLPVKDMVFVVKGKTAAVDPAQALDTSQLSGDVTSLKCKPFTHYRISFTSKEKPGGADPLRVTGVEGKRWLTRTKPAVKEENGVYRVSTTFNSLESGQLRVQIMAKDYQNLKIEPAGTLLILRRDSVPLKVTSEDGKTTYEEGKDFKKLVDPQIAKGSPDYETTHQAADIELTDDSRIKDGDRLLVSFFHAYPMGSDQSIITLEDPKVFEIMERDIANCAKVWGASGYFMNYDEIRIGGWEKPEVKPGKTLAEHVKKGYALIKKHAPEAQVYTWSDMFSPHHNARPFEARGYYYLVNGNWDGSWEGLPKDVIIMNWYSPDEKSVRFFADRGQKQVLCGYYDKKDTAELKQNINGWLTVSRGVPGIEGMMYTTWRRNFSHLKEFFQLLDTYDQWGSGPAKPEAEPGVAN